MRTCPKCKLDYSDEFSFCEFDGSTLTQSLTPSRNFRYFINTITIYPKIYQLKESLVSIIENLRKRPKNSLLFPSIGLIILIITIGQMVRVFSNRLQKDPNQSIATSQHPIFIETPREAYEYNDNKSEINSDISTIQASITSDSEQKDSSTENNPVRPGVVVFPPHKPNKTESSKSSNSNLEYPGNPLPKTQNSTNKITLTESKSSNSENKPVPENQKANKTQTKSSNLYPISTTQNFARGISLKLIRVSSKINPRSISFEITLTIQNHSGKLIQWEYISLTAQGSGGILSSSSPFFNRQGSPGNIVFTYRTPMLLTTSTNSFSVINCSLAGRTLENSKINVSLMIPVRG